MAVVATHDVWLERRKRDLFRAPGDVDGRSRKVVTKLKSATLAPMRPYGNSRVPGS